MTKKYEPEILDNPITIGLFSLFAYYLVEFFNPEMFSPLGWFSFFRKQFSYFIFYYICYCLLDSRARIIYFVRFMIALSSVAALYACKQQWFGYARFELAMDRYRERIYHYYFRVECCGSFHFFPIRQLQEYYLHPYAMLCLILLLQKHADKKKKDGWALALFVNLLGYSYSGTRTATVMFIAGILLYCHFHNK